MAEVAVVIPAYNQGHYLSVAIHSVLDQTFGDLEVLVVDDGSTDATAEVVKSLSDPRVKYFFQSNQGLPAARNTGIRNSTSKYLSFLDSDDLFLPEKIAVLRDALEANPDLGMVAGQALPVNEAGRQVGRKFETPPPSQLAELLLGNPLHVGSVLLRRSWQEKAGYFDESLRSYEDWEYWLRLAQMGCKIGWVARPVSLYRFHNTQMTRHAQQMTNASFAVLDKIFTSPARPAGWDDYRDRAYGQANLRAAAQAFANGDWQSGKTYLETSARLNPALLEGEGEKMAAQFLAWTDLPKIQDPVAFLETIYHSLPETWSSMIAKRKSYLGNALLQIAFQSFQNGEHCKVRVAVRKAIRLQPQKLFNRGVISVLLRTHNPMKGS